MHIIINSFLHLLLLEIVVSKYLLTNIANELKQTYIRRPDFVTRDRSKYDGNALRATRFKDSNKDGKGVVGDDVFQGPAGGNRIGVGNGDVSRGGGSEHWSPRPDYAQVDNSYCTPKTIMSSKNILDAKQECTRHPSCNKLFDHCGEGEKFYFCTNVATIKTSACNSILYKNDYPSKIVVTEAGYSEVNGIYELDVGVLYDEKPTFWKDNAWVIFYGSGYWFIHRATHPSVVGTRYYQLRKQNVRSPEQSLPTDWSIDYGTKSERSQPPPPRLMAVTAPATTSGK